MPSPDYIPYHQPSSPPAHSAKPSKRRPDVPPPVPSKDTEYALDKNLDDMEGIVDLNKHYELNSGLYEGVPESPSSGFESSVASSAFSSDFSAQQHAQQRQHHQRQS